MQTAIEERLKYPTIFQPFYSSPDLKYPYYAISVNNYNVYYVVIDNIMEVRRILYSKRDFIQLLI